MISLVNGEFTDKISIYDRSLQFGDGLFETCRVNNNKISLWQYHQRRLLAGSKALRIDIDFALLDNYLAKILAKFSIGGLKIIISRGESHQGYKFTNNKPNYIIYTFALADRPDNMTLDFCGQKYWHNKQLAGFKHQNRLVNVLARGSGDDCIMIDTKDNIISTTSANIFIVKDNKIYTPDLSNCGILGTRREYLLDNLYIIVKDIKTKELLESDEVFITNTTFGIVSIFNIKGKSFTTKLTSNIKNRFDL